VLFNSRTTKTLSDAQNAFHSGMRLTRVPNQKAWDPDGRLRMALVGVSGAMLALRYVLHHFKECELDKGWNDRVRAACKNENLAGLAQALLELDDAASLKLQAEAGQEPALRKQRGLWRTRQTTAWLSEARPAWRASVRWPSAARLASYGGEEVEGVDGPGHTLPALVDALSELSVSLASIRTPLRVKPHTGEGRPIRTVHLCAPTCLCSGGGCRASSVMFPMVLKQTAKCGLGAFNATPIPGGALVAPFVGELISQTEAEKRHEDRVDKDTFYTLDLDATVRSPRLCRHA
jgi:hypothetical protein